MKPLYSFIKTASLTVLTLSFSQAALAGVQCMYKDAQQKLNAYSLDCPHWYVGANVGVSHLYDSKTPRSTNSVNENGPGWSLLGGYQFNSLFGGELAYTQYHASRETAGSTNIATTEHYAVSVAATGKYPLIDKFSALAKLGVAYSYSNKVYTATGVAGAAGSVSPYAGLGLIYSITPRADFIAQWAGVRGNDYTGSATLYSLGFTFAIV